MYVGLRWTFLVFLNTVTTFHSIEKGSPFTAAYLLLASPAQLPDSQILVTSRYPSEEIIKRTTKYLNLRIVWTLGYAVNVAADNYIENKGQSNHHLC